MAGATPLTAAIRDNVLGVLRAADWYELSQVTLRLTHATWETLAPDSSGTDAGGPGADLDWWRGAEEGEQAASRTRQTRLLADLLERSAWLYAAADDWQGPRPRGSESRT